MIRCACAVLSLLYCGQAVAKAAEPELIPAPVELTVAEGQFEILPTTRILTDGNSELRSVAEFGITLLQQYGVSGQPGIAKPRATPRNPIILEVHPASGTDPEAYDLTVTSQRVVIAASDVRGLRHGLVTLWQMVSAASEPTSQAPRIQAVKIRDQPRFRWRGLMLDSARHYQSPQFIKRFIDQMALHKLNVLHWHLTDDQGWRLEIKRYPQLTAVGAWRVPAGAAGQLDIDPSTGQPRRYGGFYSQEQVRDIVAHATARGVTVMPEIEMPGHASAAIAAYPELGVTPAAVLQVPADWGVYANLFNVEPATFEFLENVLSEVMALFPSEYIHVGGDEAVKDQWRDSPRVQQRIRELQLADERALQSYFIQRIEKFLNRHGRRLIGWDEILDGGLAPNATVMSWRGLDGAIAAANAGHDAVLSPWPALYLDNRNSDSPEHPPGRGRVLSLRDVYDFDPAPAGIPDAQRRHILGIQANLWTEHMRTEERVEQMAFPRAAALAEVAWTPAARRNWDTFSARMRTQARRYQQSGVRYSTSDGVMQPVRHPRSDSSRSSHELQLCSEKLVLALEDDAPLQGPRAVFMVDIMNPCWIFPAADLGRADSIVIDVGQVPFNFQIGADVKAIALTGDPSRPAQLEIFLDGCTGERVASIPMPLTPGSALVSRLPPIRVPATLRRGLPRDVCFTFARSQVDPIWVIDRIQFISEAVAR
jgi:hexosaminidase